MNWDAVFITLGAVSLATGGGGGTRSIRTDLRRRMG